MSTRHAVLLCVLLGLGTVPAAALAEDGPEVREWNFRVLLNDKEVGYHRYRLEQTGDSRYVESDAEFDVRVLFFTAYRYRHSNREHWQGKCLAQIDTETNANGKSTKVTGERTASSFIVNKGSEVDELPACVMTFAYWDPSFLKQTRLLNAQTGELLDVTVEGAAEETLGVRGSQIPARRYRLRAEGVQIDVWYSQDDEWLALESPAKGGRILRYELAL